MIKEFLNQLKDLEEGHIDLDELLAVDKDRAIYEKWIEIFNIMSPMAIMQSLTSINNMLTLSKRDEIILLAYVKFFEQKIAMIGSLPKDLTEVFGKGKEGKKDGKNEYDGTMFG
jgi:hypothetical protein